MKIANVDFRELTKGVYVSEDGKSLAVSIYTATGIERSDGVNDVSEQIHKCLEANSNDYIENLIFDCEGVWAHDNKTFPLDAKRIRAAFTSLETIFEGSDIIVKNAGEASVKCLDEFKIFDIARAACDNGDKERGEYYYALGAVVDAFWGNNDLGGYYEETGRYEDAEECYKKISGPKDEMGDGNASYGYFLDKMGRYEEALKYFRYVLMNADTSPRDGVASFLWMCYDDEDNPYWRYFFEDEFEWRLDEYITVREEEGEAPDLEKILLNVLESENEDNSWRAKSRLIQLYGTGMYMRVGEEPIVWGEPDVETLEEFVAENVLDAQDVYDMVDRLYFDFEDGLYENAAEIIETSLLSVECSEEFTCGGNDAVESKIILFSLYYEGVYELPNGRTLKLPSLENRRAAAEMLRYADVMNCDQNPKYCELRDLGALDELIEEAYALYPQKDMIARDLVDRCMQNGEIDKVVKIIHDAEAQIAEWIAIDLFSEWDYFFDCADDKKLCEDVEIVLLAFSEKGIHKEFLLSLYQFGKATLDSRYAFKTDVSHEVVLEGLENGEKARSFADKHGLGLLTAPAVVKC